MEKDPRPRLEDLRELIRTLRGPAGCPWDRKQTPHSIKAYLLEETYEALEALEQGEEGELCAELGDLLFQLLFLVHLFEEKGSFTWEEVIGSVLDKMIRRHPHVFGEVKVRDAQEVKRNWHLIKARERKKAGGKGLMDSIPRHLPALLKAQRAGERAAKVGFDWDQVQGALAKAREEWEEFNKTLGSDPRNRAALADELGDLLFSLVNVARLLDLNAELVLQAAVGKFMRRFTLVTRELQDRGQTPEQSSLEEMDRVWEQVKHNHQTFLQERERHLVRLQERLGYQFQDLRLLESALCHRSFAHEHPHLGLQDNERLEFLGDALLDLILSRQLFQRFPRAREGELTRWRSYLVNESRLAQVARSIDLGEALFLGAGEEASGGKEKSSILADAMEALLAAVYLDGGLEAAQEVVNLLFGHLLEEAVHSGAGEDFKTRLQELTQARYKIAPQYHLLEATGPDHDKTFRVSLTLKGREVARGTGKSKKEAAQDAARRALEKMDRGQLDI